MHAEKRKGLKTTKAGEIPPGGKGPTKNIVKKRGAHSPGVDSVRNLRGTKVVKTVATSNVSGRGAKSPKSPKRATAKLVRTASEDDGAAVYPSPAHSAAFLLHSSENETSWRQYRVIRH